MDPITPDIALALIRALPGECRVLPQVLAGRNGLIFQFEAGIEIFWDSGASQFELHFSRAHRDDWAKWRSHQ